MNFYNEPLPKDMAEILAYRFINNVVEDDEVDMCDNERDGQFDEIFW